MSAFKHVFCKLGNMRKPASWVIYPLSSDVRDRVTIQCDKRIAQVRLDLGKATLSSGKGGHQGFLMLSQALGATVVDVPADILAELEGGKNANQDGMIRRQCTSEYKLGPIQRFVKREILGLRPRARVAGPLVETNRRMEEARLLALHPERQCD